MKRCKNPSNVPTNSFFFDNVTIPKKFLDFKIKHLNFSSAPSVKLITNELIRFFYNLFYNDDNQITQLAGKDVLSYSHIYEEDMY